MYCLCIVNALKSCSQDMVFHHNWEQIMDHSLHQLRWSLFQKPMASSIQQAALITYKDNGQVEWTVWTLKNLLKKADDMYLTLLVYCSTPLEWCNRSPAELCMGRKLRTNLPQVPSALIPNWTYLDQYGEADKLYKETLKRNFDQRHRVATLPEISDGSSVLVQFGKSKVPGDTIHRANAPWSYIVNTDSGVVRRNRHDLITVPPKSTPAVPSSDSTNLLDHAVALLSPVMTRSRYKMLTQRKGNLLYNRLVYVTSSVYRPQYSIHCPLWMSELSGFVISQSVNLSSMSLCTCLYNNNYCAGYRKPTMLHYIRVLLLFISATDGKFLAN